MNAVLYFYHFERNFDAYPFTLELKMSSLETLKNLERK